jgi:ORF6N domain
MQLSVLQQKIYEIRGHKVMLDFDLAVLYETETKVLNQALKRNVTRFPPDFMFKLSKEEWLILRSQIVTLESGGKGKHSKYLPNAFTEHGVTMLASILKSEKAIKMNIAIVRAFIALRQFALDYKDLAHQIIEIRQTVSGHGRQLNQIYDVIETMLDNKTEKQEEKRKWKERTPIGYK